VDVETVRRVWPDVVARLASMRRVTWMLVRDHATVASFDGRRLLLQLDRPGALANFRSGAHAEFVQQALIDVLGLEAVVEVTGGSGVDDADERAGADASESADREDGAAAAAAASWAEPVEPAQQAERAQPVEVARPVEVAQPVEPAHRVDSAGPVGTVQPGNPGAERPSVPRGPLVDAAHDHASRDDVDAADSGLVGRPVVEQLLGGTVIDETDA
jgi:DNA polymerase-3 subunit gamma/tau